MARTREVVEVEVEAVEGDDGHGVEVVALERVERVGDALVSVDLVEQARGYVEGSKSDNTLAAYRRGWRAFTGWCAQHQTSHLPADPGTVGLFLAWRANHVKLATVEQDLASINYHHRREGLDSPGRDPQLRLMLDGLRRAKGEPATKKRALQVEQLGQVLDALPETLGGVRDRALLLVGFYGALRRSELAALRVEDLAIEAEGARISLRRSKTDQRGRGREIGLPIDDGTPALCPVRALRSWLDAAGIEAGPLFRAVDRHGNVGAPLKPQAVQRAVQRAVERIGLDAAAFGAHSLRSGFITSAARRDVPRHTIARTSGHSSMTVLDGYVQRATVWEDNPAVMMRDRRRGATVDRAGA